tara:strand:- start:305 stop:442 length:138 start_codon:yes stop_codon:yes gene_type:complete
MDASSSSVAATITTVGASAAVAVTVRMVVDRGKEKKPSSSEFILR